MSALDLRSAWHAVVPAESLRDWPIGASVLDEPIALVRMNGTVVALRDVCAHMNVALSGGWVTRYEAGDELVCPSHRWRYNAAGRCTYIPELGDEQVIPEWAAVPSYSAREHYGAIWVRLQSEGQRESNELPQLPDGRWHVAAVQAQTWKAPAQTVLDYFVMQAGNLLGSGTLSACASPLAAVWVKDGCSLAVMVSVTPLTRKASRSFWIAAVDIGIDSHLRTASLTQNEFGHAEFCKGLAHRLASGSDYAATAG
ncbi:MAG: Rieske 2Fe-2S domain-containing protein [Anaerolineae bacterium]|nr:Rieske 2Fe-2S domain-containing protein [Thermoflexales bacterium]MDW8407805.1 Rieske 2Fe-2S domain-containing protein [Anaerolineae bacterium]